MTNMRITLLDSMSLRGKLALLLIIMLGALTLVVSQVATGINTQRADGILIDAAGRQRMLNQRYVKEVMHAASLGEVNSADDNPNYKKTRALFMGSLKALKDGGNLITNPGKGITVAIEAASDQQLIKSLEKNFDLASEIEVVAMNYLRSATTEQPLTPKKLLELNAKLHTEANNAVKLFVKQSSDKIDALISRLIYVSLLAAAIAIVVSYVVGSSLTNAVNLIRDLLKKAANGDLSDFKPLERKDEFGKMSSDLTHTLSAVRRALGSSSVDWDQVGSLFNDMKADLNGARAIVTQVPTTLIMLDTQGTVTYMNPQAEKEVERLSEQGTFKRKFGAGDVISQPEFGCKALWQLCSNESQLPCNLTKQFGDEHLNLSIHAATDDHGQRTGSLLSWTIVTDEVKHQTYLDEVTREENRKNQSLGNLIDGLHIAMQAAAQGDLSQNIAMGEDEKFNDIARTINQFKYDVHHDLSEIKKRLLDLTEAANTLCKSTDTMDINTHKIHQKTYSVASDTNSVNEYMTAAATATEQMTASIREIRTSTKNADHVTHEAVKLTEDATNTVQKLYQSSSDIGNVLKFITSIAEQTNLLALNATIEAARAGDAGKGFAVVANEVKELAKQTADATDEIGSRISSIQTDSTSAVECINEINDIVAKINEFQGAIASAIAEQTAVSRELSQTIGFTADSSFSIHTNIQELVKQKKASVDELTNSRDATKDVMDCTQQLEELISRYKLETTHS